MVRDHYFSSSILCFTTFAHLPFFASASMMPSEAVSHPLLRADRSFTRPWRVFVIPLTHIFLSYRCQGFGFHLGAVVPWPRLLLLGYPKCVAIPPRTAQAGRGGPVPNYLTGLRKVGARFGGRWLLRKSHRAKFELRLPVQPSLPHVWPRCVPRSGLCRQHGLVAQSPRSPVPSTLLSSARDRPHGSRNGQAPSQTPHPSQGSCAIVDGLLGSLDAFLRSFLLWQFLACLHVWAFAVPLRKERPKANRAIVHARLGLKGAPMVLLLAFCIPVAAAARGTDPASAVELSSDELAASRSPVPAMARHTRVFTRSLRTSGSADLHSTEDLGLQHPPYIEEDSPVFTRRRSQGWVVPVVVLRFQSLPRRTTLHTAAVQTEHDLAAQAEDKCEADDAGLVFFPVSPQPGLDYPVLVSATQHYTTLARIPVCFQLQDSTGGLRVWQECLDTPISLADIRLLLHDDWPAGARVMVGPNQIPLRDSPHEICAGDLVRIIPPGRHIPALVSLNAKLGNPNRYLCSFLATGFPDDPLYQSRLCLLQPLEPPKSVMSLPATNAAAFDSVLLSHADQFRGPLSIVRPQQQIRDIVLKGRTTCAIYGAFPVSLTSRVPVFVDAREILHPVQVYAAFAGKMTLGVFLTTIGLFVQEHASLVVTGTATLDPFERSIFVASGDLVCLRFSTERDDGARRGRLSAGPPTSSPDGSPSRARRFTATLTAPRVSMSAGSVRRAPGGGRTPASSSMHRSLDVLPLAPPDFGVKMCWKAVLLDPVAASVRYANLCRLRTALQHSGVDHSPLVFQENEVQPPEFAVPRPPEVPPEPPVEDEMSPAIPSPSEDTGSFLPELRCIQVVVLHFQGISRRHTLWFEAGEHISSLMLRARILLNADADFMTLDFVDPQPSNGHLTLIGFPTWWLAADLRPLVLLGPASTSMPFLHMCAPRQRADEFLQSPAIPASLQCVAYAPATSERDLIPLNPDEELPAQIVAGSLVCFQPLHAPLFALATANEHVQRLQHTVSDPEALMEGPPVDSWLAVLFGFGFDQILIQLSPGPVRQHIARALQIPLEHVFILRQLDRFEGLVVSGRRPASAFGFRNLGDMGRIFSGRGLFVDCRPVGKPACFLEVHRQALTPAMLCNWLGVTLPSGYVAKCAGGVHVQRPEEAFAFTHGSTVVLWVDWTSPTTSPSDGPTTPADDDDQEPDDTGHEDSRSGDSGLSSGSSSAVNAPLREASEPTTALTSRSRSPRRRGSALALPLAGYRDMWSSQPPCQDAPATCTESLTSVVTTAPPKVPFSDSNLRSHAPAVRLQQGHLSNTAWVAAPPDVGCVSEDCVQYFGGDSTMLMPVMQVPTPCRAGGPRTVPCVMHSDCDAVVQDCATLLERAQVTPHYHWLLTAPWISTTPSAHRSTLSRFCLLKHWLWNWRPSSICGLCVLEQTVRIGLMPTSATYGRLRT